MKLAIGTFATLSLLSIAMARPSQIVKRDATALRESYDFVIAGGGVVGLTVADRLSAAFPNKTVLVIEYGENKYAPGVFDPPTTTFLIARTVSNTTSASSPTSFAVPFLPVKDMDYRVGSVIVGKTLGGGGSINGQYLDRGNRFDYDAWAAIGGAGYEGWKWDGMFPFFKKSVTFDTPSAESVAKYGYTWDPSAWDNTTPIHASFPPFQWGDVGIARKAWKEMGIKEQKDCNGGDKDGICWVPSASELRTARRSHAAIAHYNETRRPNYDLLLLHQVVRVVYPRSPCSGPPLVETRSLADDTLFNITANAEVILSAGALHTPTILQRSGIGQKSFLDQFNIKTISNLPGVGANFQDHSGPDITWQYQDPAKFAADHYPLPAEMTNNKTFFDDAVAGFDEIPARGPYTMANTQQAVYLPLANMTTVAEHAAIIARIRAMASTSAASFLPPDLATEPTIIRGYQRQLTAIADLLANPRVPSVENPYSGSGTALKLFLTYPLSRGTVRLNASAPLDVPILDTRISSNPVDMDLHLVHLKWLRATFLKTKAMRDLGAVEAVPGDGLDNSDEEGLRAYIRRTAYLSVAHPCCTAAMMPRDLGGVVDARLRVHGVKGLRVADMSAIPLIVSAHLTTTAYAFGEKAASIIIEEWSSK